MSEDSGSAYLFALFLASEYNPQIFFWKKQKFRNFCSTIPVIPLTVNKIASSGFFVPLKPSFPLKRSLPVQSTLGFATMYIAANLDLATAKALTDLHQYINSDLVYSDLKFRPFIVK